MNDLDLPPRRALPPEVRDRIRTRATVETPRPRYKGPLSVAAAVVVLAAATAIVVQSNTPSSTPADQIPTTSSTSDRHPRDVELMDDCARVIEASPLADQYPPRSTWYWRQIIGFSTLDVDIIAFEAADKTFFCELDGGVATVSPPNAPRVPIATAGPDRIAFAMFVTPRGFLVGVAEGLDGVRMEFHYDTTSDGPAPPIRRGVFVAPVPNLVEGTDAHTTGSNDAGTVVVNGGWAYDPAQLRRPAATGRY